MLFCAEQKRPWTVITNYKITIGNVYFWMRYKSQVCYDGFNYA